MAINRTVCKEAFVEAMRERLMLDGPDLADNVDLDDVQKNLDALGRAVLDILTDPVVGAESVSSTVPPTPKDFWVWINEIQTCVTTLTAWQTALQAALDSFAAMPAPTAIDLKNALTAPPIPVPAPPPLQAPSEIIGRIR